MNYSKKQKIYNNNILTLKKLLMCFKTNVKVKNNCNLS